ncbi:MAG: hypothetical protein EOO51_04875 [Flavobacterium sp.]|nr:MAG: hypothetical protein EOO51_04875 [Flavobacterium sp.]
MRYLQNISNGIHGLTELEFFDWFIVFSISTAILLLEHYTAIDFNIFLRLFFWIVSISLLCFWISWILLGYKAIRLRGYIFSAVVVVCSIGLFWL